jgi:RNA polymerase-interacting CarD/CdnL/TRCF family regulator
MEIKYGDCVVHPTFGIGYVEAIEDKEIGEDGIRTFYRIAFFKMTVWVPFQHSQSSRLRPVTPPNDLARYRAVLSSQPATLDSNFRLRQIELENRLKQGTFQELCEVVRDLSARSWLKSLSSFESALLKKTRSFLNQEWAATSGKSLNEATGEVESCLMEGKQRLANG